MMVNVFVVVVVVASSSKSSRASVSSHKSGACSTKQPASTKPSTQTKSDTKKPATPTPVAPALPSPATEPAQKPSGPPNKPSFQARLGLARVLMRKGGESISEGHKLYEEVITMAPAVHDAYIELADSLVKADPMKAVDVYGKYPFQVRLIQLLCYCQLFNSYSSSPNGLLTQSHEGKRNNCFSKIQLVGQKYRE